MEALVGVPMESLKRGGDIEVLIYNFSQHNKYSFIHLTERNNAQRYFFRFKNEQLVKYGPM
jgi:hypothetical protein